MRNLYKPTCLFIFLFVLTASVALSQNRKIDSLKLLLPKLTDQQRGDILSELGYAYLVIGDYPEALKYSDELLSRGELRGDSLQIVRGSAIKASVLRRSGLTDSAMQLYNKVLPIARRKDYEREVKDISNSLGALYTLGGYYDKALQFLLESLVIREKLGNEFDISVTLQNIGLVYYKLGNYQKAILSYNRSLTLRKGAKSSSNIGILFINLGLCYVNMQDYSMANKYIDEAFSSCRNDCDDYFLMSAHYCRGTMFFDQKNFQRAESEFLESYILSMRTNDVRFQLDNLGSLSEIHIQGNKLLLAEKYLLEAEEIITSDARYRLELVEIYSQMSNLYRQNKNYKKLSFYQEKYITLRDSLFNEEVTTNLMKAEASYVEKENKARIESQNKILVLNEEVIYRQKIANASFGATACLVLILSFVLAKNNRQKQLRNKLLDVQVKERTKELEMNRDALERAWQERDVLISKASSDIQSSIATLKGLSSLGAREIDHPKATEYWKQLDNTSNGLSAIMNKMHYSYKINAPLRD
jgi:tetratricopeptide (TPR) repeat protein